MCGAGSPSARLNLPKHLSSKPRLPKCCRSRVQYDLQNATRFCGAKFGTLFLARGRWSPRRRDARRAARICRRASAQSGDPPQSQHGSGTGNGGEGERPDGVDRPQGDEKILESHRREIVVVFCDLRGYTAFAETAEPEEVLDFLREYHGALGPLVAQFEGTLEQFSGDGIMVFFNDPVPCPDLAERAVNMVVAMREAAGTLIADWRERGRDLGFGAGIAQGYATLGQIGFSERSGYTAIGTVCDVAARLCAEAKDGQILLSRRVNAALRGSVVTEQVGALALKGLAQPVVAYNVPLGSQAAFRVIERGAPTA